MFCSFRKEQDQGVFCEEGATQGQGICLCTQLQRHVLAEVITGSHPAAAQVGIFQSG